MQDKFKIIWLHHLCVGTTNGLNERYLFIKYNQAVIAFIDAYIAALYSLSKTHNYDALMDNLIWDLDKGIWWKLLQERKLTLTSVVSTNARATTPENEANWKVSYLRAVD